MSSILSVGGGPSAYRPAIDGLRAIAVTAVVMFHAFPMHIPGGFVGVDVFFVISGFLITQILYREIAAGSFTLVGFYHRRVRRLLPAFMIVLATVIVTGSLLLLPTENRALNLSSLASLVFASNIFFWMQTGYFAPNADTLPLLHTWSLAVEEQFYIAFPVFLYALQRWAPRQLPIAVIAVALLSLAICLWGTFYKPGATFYLAPFRAWELLVGALIFLCCQHLRLSRLSWEIMAAGGLGLIVAGVLFVDKATPVPGIGALPAVAGAAAVVLAAVAPTNTITTRLLAWQPIVGLGLVSYPLYLWHWPALVLSRELVGGTLDPLQTWAVLISCVLLSTVTYLLVETPVRSKIVLASKTSVFVAAAAVTTSIAAFNAVIVMRDGYLLPVEAEVKAGILANRRAVVGGIDPCTSLNYMRRPANAEDVAYCPLEQNSRSRGPTQKVLFWGDSFMEHWLPAVSRAQELGAFTDRQIIFAVSQGCQPTPGLERRERGFYCEAFNRYVQSRASAPDIDGVVIGGAWSFAPSYLEWVGHAKSNTIDANELMAHAERELVALIKPLTTAGKKVALILSFPVYGVDVSRYLERRLIAGQPAEVLQTRSDAAVKSMATNEMLKRVAARTGATSWDPLELLCPTGACIYHRQMLTYYRDHGHLTKEGSRQLLLPMIQAMAEELALNTNISDDSSSLPR